METAEFLLPKFCKELQMETSFVEQVLAQETFNSHDCSSVSAAGVFPDIPITSDNNLL